MADFKFTRFKYTWRGQWTVFERYNPDDVVGFGSKVYVSLETHNANPDFYSDLNFLNNDTPPQPAPKWELIADGKSWQGDWLSDTYYTIGDVVKKGGTLYLCVEGHTSATKFRSVEVEDGVFEQEINPSDPLGEIRFDSTDTSYWTILLESRNWGNVWQVATYYKLNDVVRYGGRTYICVFSHLSSGSVLEGLEANQSDWQVFSIQEEWKGQWAINTRYKVNDLVKYGGRVYKCEVGHESAGSEIDGLYLDLGKWSEFFNGHDYRSDWTENTIYLESDVVKYGSYTYKCINFHTSEIFFEPENWEVFVPGQEFDLVWNDETVYQSGDIVRYGGDLFVANEYNIGRNPSTTASWDLLFNNTRIQGQWNKNTQYLQGDVVRRGGNVYLAKIDNLGQDPDLLEDDSTTNSTYWDLLIPGIRWQGEWTAGRFYVVGDAVVWNSGSYKCLDRHLSTNQNRPDDDPEDGSTLQGRYWKKITQGNRANRLKVVGDIKTFGDTGDGSTIGTTNKAVGNTGQVLKSVSNEVQWRYMQNSANVYFVAEFGEDLPTAGTSPQSPWRSVRYALENITGYATVFVRTGTYDEILPLRVPEFVAIVGDELRSTLIRPAAAVIDRGYVDKILSAADYLKIVAPFIVTENPIGTEDAGDPAFGTLLYGEIAQVFLDDPATVEEQMIVDSLLGQFYDRLDTRNPSSITGTNTPTIISSEQKALALLQANREFLKNEVTLYIESVYVDSTLDALPDRWSTDIDRLLAALEHNVEYTGNFKMIQAADFFINSYITEANKQENMFLLRDGTGLRNCTLSGLEGTLSAQNIYGTSRPSAGAYASLDPGWGPNDSSAWVGTKSPYVQNVTTFGTACVGLKVDGNLHAGGNQTIVTNDFTQVLSDGIGVWCNGTGRSECVSVFTYYNHIGYLCTEGGKIRGTNGNCSYGKYGAVSEGSNVSETPITALVNNRYYHADVERAMVRDNGILKLFFSNAGVNYTNASMSIVGAGTEAELIADEFRDGAVFEVRIADPGDSSAAGGFGYKFNANASQGGDDKTILLAGSDTATLENYYGMRIILISGDGTGQYGYIADFDESSKEVIVGKETKPITTVEATASSGSVISVGTTAHLNVDDAISFYAADAESYFGNIQPNTIYYVRSIVSASTLTISATLGGSVYFLINATGTMSLHVVGWDHVVEGYPIESVLDTSAYYSIEPRITFSEPGRTTTTVAINAARQWISIAANLDRYVAVALDTNIAAYSSDGESWTNTTMPIIALWNKIKYVGGYFVAVALGGQAAKSVDGITWTAMTMPYAAEWADVAYGNGTWIVIASGGTRAAKTTDLTTWSAVTLPEGADWVAIEYGKGKFVAVAQSDSGTGTDTVYSENDGDTWTAGNISSGMISLTYGNNRFVALSGGYAGATEVSISFDGINWTESTIAAADWREVKYGQGIFVAIGMNHQFAAISLDGKEWEYEDIGNSNWKCLTFGNISKPGKWLILAGLTAPSTAIKILNTGRRAEARAVVVSQKISDIIIWEPGCGYTSTPNIVLTDPNPSFEVTLSVRIGDGVVANPNINNAGIAYETNTTTVTVTGNGYRDQYQIGGRLIVDQLTRIPGPGDNVTIVGIDDYIYKLTSFTILSGTVGNYTAMIGVAKQLNRDESPEHNTQIQIRQLYSQVRLTGHDFLDIGLGNFIQTNYPNTLFPNGTVLAPEDESRERAGGRVFYTSTDQDGNFRVGELFAVEQSTGTVTLSADFFVLEGLEELTIGGVTVGGTGVVIREFSTEPTFIADSNNILPTQKAIKTFLAARVSGGGADAITGQLTAGVTRVGPDQIDTTTGDELIVDVKVNFRGGVDGDFLTHALFVSGNS